MAGEDIVRGGLGTLVQLKTIGGGNATLVAIRDAQVLVQAAQAEKADLEMDKLAKAEAIVTLETRQATIADQIDEYQVIVDDPGAEPEAQDEAQEQIDLLAAEETENATTLTGLESDVTALDVDIAAQQTIIDTQTTTIEGLEAVAGAGIFVTIPNVEEIKTPKVVNVFDSFVPIDGATGGYPVEKPTGAKENSEWDFTVVFNGFDTTHQQLRNAANNSDRCEFRIIFTDGVTAQYFAYVKEWEPNVDAKKLNRSKFTVGVDGRILWN